MAALSRIRAPVRIRMRHGIVPALTSVTVAAAVTTAAHAAPWVYVANLGSATVSVIDAATNTVVATIPVGSDPDGIAATQDGRTVFVSNFVSDNVSRIDTATNTVARTIPTGDGPVGIALSADGTLAYVANKLSNTVSVLRTDTGETVAALPAGPGPNGVAVSPDGSTVYVTNSRSKNPGTVTVIDAHTNAVVGAIPVQHSPGRVAFSPDGRRAYVSNFNSWTVSVIDTAASAVMDTLSTWGRPAHVAVNPNGAFVYVSALGGRVQVIDARTHEITGLIGVETSPYSFALLPTGAAGFATGFDAGTVSVVDVLVETEVAVVPVGARPFAAVVVCPGGCADVPFTPAPTRTPTVTPVVSPTRTSPPSATSAPTHTPAPTPHVVLFAEAQPARAGRVTIDVRLDTGGDSIAAVQNEFVFDRFALGLPSRDACVINPAISDSAPECDAADSSAACKALSTSGQWACYDSVMPTGCPNPNTDPRGRVRLLILSFTNTRPIPDGLLYSCTFDILDPARLPATVSVKAARASDPSGQPIWLRTNDVVASAVRAGLAGLVPAPHVRADLVPALLSFEPGAPADIVVPLENSRPVHVVSGFDGEVWFTDAGADRVGRIDAGGEMTLFRLPALSGPVGLAVDPDGIVWVALNDRNRMARIDPDTGAVDEFGLPRAAQPFGVAVGADGNIWFTEIGENAVGRLTPDGAVTHFPLPTRLAVPMGIAAATDGHLWFTEHNANRIGRIDVYGTITEYSLPSAGSAPLGITTAADGSVWFTQLRGGRLGRVTTGGMITEVGLPGAGSRPTGIAAGQDGTVWITDTGTHQLLRLAPNGPVEVVAQAPGLEAGSVFGAGITVGDAGGTVIYAQTARGSLARVGVAPVAAAPTFTPSPSPTPGSPSSASPTPMRASPSPESVQQTAGNSGGGCQTTSGSGPAAWVLLLPHAILWCYRRRSTVWGNRYR